MAVARLRAALGGANFIQTVVKRGYRLRLDS
jgi:DNA-binding winged helix-turn-helix (wHTH) protein